MSDITGKDVLEIGVPEGPLVGLALKAVNAIEQIPNEDPEVGPEEYMASQRWADYHLIERVWEEPGRYVNNIREDTAAFAQAVVDHRAEANADLTVEEVVKLGIPEGPMASEAVELSVEMQRHCIEHADSYDKQAIRAANSEARNVLFRLADDPRKEKSQWLEDVSDDRAEPSTAIVLALAEKMAEYKERMQYRDSRAPMDKPIKYNVWRGAGIDKGALEQIERAARLPVVRAAALMPDAHLGYGLPVGGVMALDNAVSPYAVGVDISCSMALSLTPVGPEELEELRPLMNRALKKETRFGMGCSFKDQREHPVMEDWRWDDIPWLSGQKGKAGAQLGTSGGGNHFVEFGIVELEAPVDSRFGKIKPGTYIGLLSHSGSRGLGHTIAQKYSKRAKDECYGLSGEFNNLAWLDLDSGSGQEYWTAMQLARNYALANHELIHEHVLRASGLSQVFYHAHSHNLAWKETHEIGGQEEVIVHRKGATPAAKGQLGLIPGTMGDPGFIVRGKGEATSLKSSSHGAGRQMGRREAKRKLNGRSATKEMASRGIDVIGSGLDEHPDAYKDIRKVMKAQEDLVDTIGEFHPKVVRMAK